MITEDDYKRWVRAAYLYYIEPDEFGDTGMTDYQWDYLSRQLYAVRDEHPDWEAIQHPNFAGMSLFFLRREDYPDWAKE
jgi:hypothetical protein